MKLHETRPHAHGHGTGDEEIIMTRKQKAEQLKINEFEEFCKAIREFLSIAQMREILEANGQDSSGSDASVSIICLDMLFYGLLEKCQICNGDLEFDGNRYSCKGTYSEWSSCVYKTRSPARKQEPPKLPDSAMNSPVADLLKKYEDPSVRPYRLDIAEPLNLCSLTEKAETLHVATLLMQQLWKSKIEKHGGKSPTRIEKQGVQPLEAYDIVTDLSVDGKGIPWDKQVSDESALESFSAEVCHFTSLLAAQAIWKKRSLQGYQIARLLISKLHLYRYCIMQLIKVPDGNLHLYYKKGRVGDDPNAQEKLEEWKDLDGAVKEFVRLFEEVTGNEFEPWEREKKFQKKPLKFYPIDMDDRVDARCGRLCLRQLGVAAAHCKLEPMVANFMKVLCSREIYKYALMEMDLDAPDLPMGMLSECATSFECVRDIVVASQVIGHMGEDILDDPLSDRYKRIGCSISPVDKDSDDNKMILNHVEKTYEPVKVADILRHLLKGFLPASCSLPVPGYMFGKGIVCSDAAAEAARYGFTAVDRPEGFLVLAVFSQGEEIIEREKKACVKGLGRKKPDESEFIDWKDDIKVPCGRLIPSEHKNSPLEFNEYTIYDPKQVRMKFLVGVMFEEKGAVLDTED
ncbi:Poly polymerase 3 [Hibiscus syriacus]|uniref:Poly [ADP-ribose] polymerase n=1 Tax=Hibiscus syriacus TaxID=106335 RepID=A0A6A3AB54_HIBSY|nr:Poly polymerase 3 [Hibiscus syriacus]